MESSPEVIFDPQESEVVHAELDELNGRAECLEEELTQLQALVRSKYLASVNIIS